MSKELPIIICTDLIPATMDGRKTLTRRVILPQPEVFDNAGIPDYSCLKQRYHKGDLLWVREGWRCTGGGTDRNIIYRADGDTAISYCGIDDGRKSILHAPKEYWDKWDYYVYKSPIGCNWRPPIHMPKWVVRTWLEVLDIRAERLQEITEKDAIKEGIQLYEYGTEYDKDYGGREKNMNYSVGYGLERLALSVMPNKASGGFRRLWDSLNAKRGYGWDVNPGVWRYEFKRIQK